MSDSVRVRLQQRNELTAARVQSFQGPQGGRAFLVRNFKIAGISSNIWNGMYWDTYCVLHTLKVIGLVSFKAPLCKSKCELPPSFWTPCDFHACLTCAWNMSVGQKWSLSAYVLNAFFVVFGTQNYIYYKWDVATKILCVLQRCLSIGTKSTPSCLLLEPRFFSTPSFHHHPHQRNVVIIVKEPYKNHNHQNYSAMEVYRVLRKMFLFSSM